MLQVLYSLPELDGAIDTVSLVRCSRRLHTSCWRSIEYHAGF